MGPIDAATHRERTGGALWSALGGDPARAGDVEVRGSGRHLPSAFAVDELAVGAVACVLLAAAELAEAHGARRPVATPTPPTPRARSPPSGACGATVARPRRA